MPRVALAGVAVVTAVGGVAACGVGDARSTSVSGGSAQQRAVLAELVHRLGATRMQSARIHRGTPNGAGVTVEVRFPRKESFFDSWQGLLLAESFVEQSLDRHLPAVRWYDDDGEGSDLGYLHGHPKRPPPLARDPVRHLDSVLRQFTTGHGAVIEELRILRLYRAAIVLRIRTRQPARLLQSQTQSLLAHLDFWGSTYDGVFLAIDDWRGGRVYEVASTSIGGISTVYQYGPFGQYQSCFGLAFPGPAPRQPPQQPPPCPREG